MVVALAGWLSAACSSGVNIAPPQEDDDVSGESADASGDAADGNTREPDAAPGSSRPGSTEPDAGAGAEPSPSAKPTGSFGAVVEGLGDASVEGSSPNLIFPETPPGPGGAGGATPGPAGAGGTGDWPMGGAAGASGGSSTSSGGSSGSSSHGASAGGAGGGGGAGSEPEPPWSESNELRIDVAEMLTASGCDDYPLSEPIFFRFRLDEFQDEFQSMHVLAPSVFAEYDHTELSVESVDGGAPWPNWMTIGMNVVESVTVTLVGEVPVPTSFSETLVVSRASDACPLLAVPLQIDLE